MAKQKFTIIRDTKEKEGHGWLWRASANCTGTEKRAMKTGDYTVDGLEDKFVIERKGSISEWAGNVTQKRFHNELNRLDDLPCSWILLEFEMSDLLAYPVGSGIPKYKWKYIKVRGPCVLALTMEMMLQHNSHIIFCGNKGREVALSIFKRMVEQYGNKKA